MSCTCIDWNKVCSEHENLFRKHNPYGTVISWIEISNEGNHHKIHNYGIEIQYCPFCGKKLTHDI